MFTGIADAAWKTLQKNSMWKFFMHSIVKMMSQKYNNGDWQRAVADRGKSGDFWKREARGYRAASILAASGKLLAATGTKSLSQ
jgi:hypothetical protein